MRLIQFHPVRLLREWTDLPFNHDAVMKSIWSSFDNHNLRSYTDIFAKRYLDHDDPAQDAEIVKMPQFRQWMEGIWDDELGEIEYAIGKQVKNNLIEIYRVLTVSNPNEWVENLPMDTRPLGTYWAWDRSQAETHWGDRDHHYTVCLTTVAALNQIDWVRTMEVNITAKEEAEITLLDGAGIVLKAIEVVNHYDTTNVLKSYDISALKNRIFKA